MEGLLSSSAADGGAHLRGIFTADRRPSAQEICAEMAGMRLLTVATVTADGRPITGPLDGYLLHGSLWVSSSPDSVRMRHLAQRSAVSATYLPGERFALIVHGTAELRPLQSDAAGELRQAMLDHYVPLQGPSFVAWLEELDGIAVRIVAKKMFAFRTAD